MMHLPPLSSFVNFGVLVGGLAFLLRKPVTGFLQSRSETLSKNLTESKKLREEAQTMLAQYKGKMDQLDAEVEEILSRAKKDGQQMRDDILARAATQAETTMSNAKIAANNQAEKMKETLQQEVMEKALAQASQKVASQAGAKEHDIFVNQFIDQLQGGFDGSIS